MTDLKTQRNPLLPAIPTKEEWDKFPRIEQWRRSQLTVIEGLHASVYDDLSNVANDAANANANVALLASNVANLRPCPMIVFPWASTNQVGTWAATMDANQIMGVYYKNTSNANDDYLRWWVTLAAGGYWFDLLGVKTANGGRFQVYWNGSAANAAVFDLYAASTTYNHNVQWQMSISNGGMGVFDIRVVGKNASSSGYYLNVTQVGFRRSGG